jgi:hypothetical protein
MSLPLKFTGSFAPQSRVLRPVASPQESEQPGGFGADLPVLIPWLACPALRAPSPNAAALGCLAALAVRAGSSNEDDIRQLRGEKE